MAAMHHLNQTVCQTPFSENSANAEAAGEERDPSPKSSVFICFNVHTQVVNLERSLNLSESSDTELKQTTNIFRIYPQPVMKRLKEKPSYG